MTTERFQEAVLGLTALLWGGVLMIPRSAGSPQRFAALVDFLPDYAWGVLLMACGVTVLSLAPLRWRKQAHALLCVVWALVVTLILLRGVSTTAVLLAAPFVAITLLHFFEYLKLSQLAKL